MNKKFFFLGLFCILLNSVIATEAITIDMVTVGNTNNPPDTAVMNDNTTGYGSVSYPFQIGKYEITTGQFATFLNAVARNSDPYSLRYSYSGTEITYDSNTHIFTASSPNQPMDRLRWLGAARFCNWLVNGQPNTGIEDSTTTEDGSYYLNGATQTNQTPLTNLTRKPNATWVLPSENEWYKAAYYDPNKNGQGLGGYWTYATMSDTSLNGTNPSAYGTFNQDDSVYEWTDTLGSSNYTRVVRGMTEYSTIPSCGRVGWSETNEPNCGFRVALVPEPNIIILLFSSILAISIKSLWNSP